MYRGRCNISGCLKGKNFQQISSNFYKKSLDFCLAVWYHNKCTEEHMKNKDVN